MNATPGTLIDLGRVPITGNLLAGTELSGLGVSGDFLVVASNAAGLLIRAG